MKSCPFCGMPQDNQAATAENDIFSIICLYCQAAGPVADTMEDAEKKWNDRSE